MKSLKPSHRERKRYLLICGKDADKKNIDEAIFAYVGFLGHSKACPQIIKKTKDAAIFSINRQSLNEVRASFLFSGKGICIKKVSGSIKNLK
jgi:RNase P/RNase MRP subunit POP5